MRIGVRPEKLNIQPAGATAAAGRNSVRGVVTASTYTGVSTSYECTTPSGAKLAVYVQNASGASSLGPGTQVTLSWDPEHTFAVADPSNRKEGGGPDERP